MENFSQGSRKVTLQFVPLNWPPGQGQRRLLLISTGFEQSVGRVL